VSDLSNKKENDLKLVLRKENNVVLITTFYLNKATKVLVIRLATDMQIATMLK
jgi:hypothetical protein